MRLRWIVFSLMVLGCGRTPPDYRKACDRESDCDEPLQCLEGTEAVGSFCTFPCEDDDECAQRTGSGCFACEGGVCGASKCD